MAPWPQQTPGRHLQSLYVTAKNNKVQKSQVNFPKLEVNKFPKSLSTRNRSWNLSPATCFALDFAITLVTLILPRVPESGAAMAKL